MHRVHQSKSTNEPTKSPAGTGVKAEMGKGTPLSWLTFSLSHLLTFIIHPSGTKGV